MTALVYKDINFVRSDIRVIMIVCEWVENIVGIRGPLRIPYFAYIYIMEFV